MSNKTLPVNEIVNYQNLFDDIVKLIQAGKSHVATEVNSTVVVLYWSIGKRINHEVLADNRASNDGSGVVQ